MNFTEQLEWLKTKPVIEFTDDIDNAETYLESSMRANVISIAPDSAGVYMLSCNVSGFEEHNKNFESHNYFDSNQNPVLSAREAGYYTDIVVIYVCKEFMPFKAVSENSVSLFDAYSKDKSDLSYIAWLESKIKL
jgi:hypothetical protein